MTSSSERGTATRALPHGLAMRHGEVELEVTFIAPGIVRLRYRGPFSKVPTRSFAVVGTEEPPDIARDRTPSGGTCVRDAALVVTVDASGRVTVADAGGVVLLRDGAEGGYREEPSGKVVVRRETVAGDRFYGLGEKTGSFERRGRRYQFRNTDAFDKPHGGFAPDGDPLYQSVPFYVCVRDGVAYGVFTDNTFDAYVDLAATHPEVVEVGAAGGLIDQYVLAGPSFSAVLERFRVLTGPAPRPPKWALGYHQCRWGWPRERVERVMKELRARKIPADGIWLDIQHMDGFRSFTFDRRTYPDPECFMNDAQAQGFKPVVIVDPALKHDPTWDVFEAAVAGGHVLTTSEGEPYVGEVWPGPAVFPDFSREATRRFWADLVAGLRARGVKGIWIDMNEPSNFIDGGSVPHHVIAAHDGSPTTMAEIRNVYGHLMAEATFAGLRQAAPDERPFILTRAGYAGTHRYAAMWTGDAPSTFTTLEGVLPMLLGVGISGQPFGGSDVGGFSGYTSPELFARWMAVGAISPFFRGHVTSGVPFQEPWELGPEVEAISRAFIEERYRLMPYLYSLFDAAHERGEPILRPLVYAFQDDPRTHTIGDEALLGPFLLVAPVTREGATTREVYLPVGRWLDVRSGAVHEGPTTISVETPLAVLPMFMREGAIVPRGPSMQWVDEVALDPLTLDVFAAGDFDESAFAFYEDDGMSMRHEAGEFRRVTYTLVEHECGVRFEASPAEGSDSLPPRTLVVKLRCADRATARVMLDGEVLPHQPDVLSLRERGRGWTWSDDGSVLVVFHDHAPFVLETHGPARAGVVERGLEGQGA